MTDLGSIVLNNEPRQLLNAITLKPWIRTLSTRHYQMYIDKQCNILIFRDITKDNVHIPYLIRSLYRFIFAANKNQI